MELHPANDKLHEAEFFFRLMEKHFDHNEFRYFLSAFLSALYSCKEHDRLHSADPRFKDWYQEIKKTHINHINLLNLLEMRRHEVHKKGKETVQQVGLGFPDGIETTGLEL